MWRMKSSIMSSINAINNDPPASNRRDPDEERATVMDRPLAYSNVAAEADLVSEDDDDDAGLTVVPAVEDEENEPDDIISNLSLSPNQFTDSLLEAMKKLEDKEACDVILSPQHSTNETSIKLDTHPIEQEVNYDDDDEVVWVDEMTTKEEDILAMLESKSTPKDSVVTRIDTVNKNTDAIVVFKSNEPKEDITESEADDNESQTKSEGQISLVTRESEVLDMYEVFQNMEVELEPTESAFHQQEKLNRALLSMGYYFTIGLGTVAFLALAFGSSKKAAQNDIFDMAQEMAVDDMLPNPAPTSSQAMATFAVPLCAFEKNESIMEKDGAKEFEDSPKTTENVEFESYVASQTKWYKPIEYVVAASVLTMYYFVRSKMHSPSDGEKDSTKQSSIEVKSELASLNSFEGLRSFQKAFVKSGKGRRSGPRTKLDTTSYDKLTRVELLQILDGFGRYKGRNASKSKLIDDLCALYEETLFRFTNTQILEILQTKGYSADTTFKKNELVALAVKVGF